jgi:hypothetical protein
MRPDLGSVSVTLTLPLQMAAWVSHDATLQASRDFANLTLLNGLAALDKPAADLHADNPDSPQLQRLEAKIDLGLQMLGQLLNANAPLPAQHDVLLSAQALAWRCSTPPPATELQLQLFIDSRIPQPLQLKARLDGQQGEYWVARFEEVSEALQDALDRAVFRWHRRQVQAGQGH